MIPAGKFDRIIEPIDQHFGQSIFKLCEGDGIAGQDIEADERSTLGIAGVPLGPDRKGSGSIGETSDEFAQGRSDG
jgi:hypothetical protein